MRRLTGVNEYGQETGKNRRKRRGNEGKAWLVLLIVVGQRGLPPVEKSRAVVAFVVFQCFQLAPGTSNTTSDGAPSPRAGGHRGTLAPSASRSKSLRRASGEKLLFSALSRLPARFGLHFSPPRDEGRQASLGRGRQRLCVLWFCAGVLLVVQVLQLEPL